ncbi:MAG TPA: hypothetical protein VFY59_03795 [Rubrobacter sp.]|nr:hypothetical protein [Rubrobacter sp.]
MRGVVVWLSGATLAFLLTAGAFLLLANIATIPDERTLSPKPPAAASQTLVGLELDPDQLASLRSSTDQNLDLTLRNEGDSPLTHVNVTLMVSSENTALSASRYYQHSVARVPARGATNLRFGFDLSEPKQHVTGRPASEPAREILEFKATTPGGISTTKTVILPP